jgi:hypothetical protein
VTDPVLARLLLLRRQNERRALEAVMKHEAICRRAMHEVEVAADAALQHAHEARVQEQRILASLVGRRLSPAALAHAQCDLDAIAMRGQDLRARHEAAQAAFHDRRETADAARKDFRARQRIVAKLDFVAKQAAAREARQQAVLAEHADEDRSATNTMLRPQHRHES